MQSWQRMRCCALGLFILLTANISWAQDIFPPTINVLPFQNVECTSGMGQAHFSINATATDNVTPIVIPTYWQGAPVASPQIFDPSAYNLGDTFITVQACDNANNCAQTVTTIHVADTQPPVISVPQVYSADCAGPTGTTVNLASIITVFDNCDTLLTQYFHDAPASFPVGTTTVNITAIDGVGLTSVQSFNVAVTDTTPPAIGTVGSITIDTAGAPGCDIATQTPAAPGNGVMVSLPEPVVTDTCTDGFSLNRIYSIPDAPKPATTTQQVATPYVCLEDGAASLVTLDVIDSAGNRSTAPFNVTLATTPPTSTLNLAASGTNVTSSFVYNTLPLSFDITATGGTGNHTWNVIGGGFGSIDLTPDASTPSDNVLSAQVTNDGIYCPVYVNVNDSIAQTGTTTLCFAVDTTPPVLDQFSLPNIAEYFIGQQIPITLNAHDNESGIKSIKIDIASQGTYTLDFLITTMATTPNVYDSADETTPIDCAIEPVAGYAALTGCENSRAVAGCNVSTSYTCDVATPTSAGLLTLNNSAGMYDMVVDITDKAGNTTRTIYALVISGFDAGLTNSLTDVDDIRNNTATPPQAWTDLDNAKTFLTTANKFKLSHPGHTAVFIRQAWNHLKTAETNGANVAALLGTLTDTVVSQAQQYLTETQTNGQTEWKMLDSTGTIPLTDNRYMERAFLHPLWDGAARDYVLVPTQILSRAKGFVDAAIYMNTQGKLLESIDASRQAINELGILFNDSILASMLGTAATNRTNTGTSATTWELSSGVAEAYYDASIPADIGANIAKTVAAQVARAASDPALPASAKATLDALATSFDRFDKAVSKVQAYYAASNNTSLTLPNLTNKEIMTDVYLMAQRILENLQSIQSSSIYTGSWRTGMALTLGMVANFSMYEGYTALASGKGKRTDPWGGTYPDVAINDMWANNESTPPNTLANNIAQVAECRYNRLMYALADGRVTDAMNLFAKSKCIMIELYNQYYGAQQILAADTPIDPTDYNDPTNPASVICPSVFAETYTHAQVLAECDETTLNPPGPAGTDVCNGIDDDGDMPGCSTVGQTGSTCGIDEDFVSTSCGEGECLGYSQCVGGVVIPCAPPAPPVLVDTTCNNKDDDCDGQIDEDWVPTVCGGMGACQGVSTCPKGAVAETPCVATAPPMINEICDGLDNNCDGIVDNNLDKDHDGYGCDPDNSDDPSPCDRSIRTSTVDCSVHLTPSACDVISECTWSFNTSTNTSSCQSNNPCKAGYLLKCTADSSAIASCNDLTVGPLDCDDTDPAMFPGNKEVCDYKDNDCDGDVDEGVLTACNDCSPSCQYSCYGNGTNCGTPFMPQPDNAISVVQNPDGTLSIGQVVAGGGASVYAWIANSDDGTVSKVDTQTHKEVARYCSAVSYNAATRTYGAAGLCGPCNGCNTPSRTAVNLEDDMFVANRVKDGGGQSTLTKIAGALSRCDDRNSDGNIETSRDVNNDGFIDVTDPNEYLGEQDECILWTKRPNTWGSGATQTVTQNELNQLSNGAFVARGVVVDAQGNVWFGNHREKGYFKVDPKSGFVLRWEPIGVSPYGGVIDSAGILWTSSKYESKLVGLNITSQVVTHGSTTGSTTWQPLGDPGGNDRVTIPVPSTYGIAIDGKNRVWFGSKNKSFVAGRYDPSDQTLTILPSDGKPGAGDTKGVTVSASGIVWTGQRGKMPSGKSGRIVGYNVDTMQIAVVNGRLMDFDITPGGDDPHGVGIGYNGTVWTGGNVKTDNITSIDPQTGIITHVAVGAAPESYSDFTGSMLKTFTAPSGSYTETLVACPSAAGQLIATSLSMLTWTARTPGTTSVDMTVRVRDTSGWGNWSSAYRGSSINDVTNGSFDLKNEGIGTSFELIQIKATLNRDADGKAPTFVTFGLARNCPAPAP